MCHVSPVTRALSRQDFGLKRLPIMTYVYRRLCTTYDYHNYCDNHQKYEIFGTSCDFILAIISQPMSESPESIEDPSLRASTRLLFDRINRCKADR